MKKFLLVVVCAAAFLASPAQARYRGVEIQAVPIARLITNLTNQLKDKPNDAELHYALARVHSMAYALKKEEADADKQTEQPFYGYGPGANLPPTKVETTADADKTKAAKAHLDEAIKEYTKAAELDPKNLYARLGLAWCLEQSGDKAKALDSYRKALDLAWAAEKDQPGILGTSFTEEIARYMLPLLDPKKDEAEITKIKGYQEVIAKKGRGMTPVVIPLTDETALDTLVTLKKPVAFDLDGSGRERSWGWVTPKAGWLVYDADGRGKITSGIQMVGAVTFWVMWKNGYAALASLDDDRNGWLEGAELRGLAIWRDENSNGVSEPGEVQPLSTWNITGLSTSSEAHGTGIPFNSAGVRLRDGSTRPSYDWISTAK